jgi:hypothetical protein
MVALKFWYLLHKKIWNGIGKCYACFDKSRPTPSAQQLTFLIPLTLKQGQAVFLPAGCTQIDVVIYRSLSELTSHWAIRSPSPSAAPLNDSSAESDLPQRRAWANIRVLCISSWKTPPAERFESEAQREMFLARRNLLEVGGASRMYERIMPSHWSQLLYIEVFAQRWCMCMSLSVYLTANTYVHTQAVAAVAVSLSPLPLYTYIYNTESALNKLYAPVDMHKKVFAK